MRRRGLTPQHKLPSAHVGSHAQILKMLAIANVNGGGGGAGDIQLEIADGLFSQIKDQVNAVTLGRRQRNALRAGIGTKCLALTEGQSGILLHGIGIGGKNALTDQAGGASLLHAQLWYGARHKNAAFFCRLRRLPGCIIAGKRPDKAEAKLLCDLSDWPAAIAGQRPNRRGGGAGCKQRLPLPQLKAQPGRFFSRNRGICAGIVYLDLKQIFAFGDAV